jgi:hypothetical protein
LVVTWASAGGDQVDAGGNELKLECWSAQRSVRSDKEGRRDDTVRGGGQAGAGVLRGATEWCRVIRCHTRYTRPTAAPCAA